MAGVPDNLPKPALPDSIDQLTGEKRAEAQQAYAAWIGAEEKQAGADAAWQQYRLAQEQADRYALLSVIRHPPDGAVAEE